MLDGRNGNGTSLVPAAAAAAAAAACMLFLSVACISRAVVVGSTAIPSAMLVGRGANADVGAGVTVVLVVTVVVVAAAVVVLLLLSVKLPQASSDKC